MVHWITENHRPTEFASVCAMEDEKQIPLGNHSKNPENWLHI
jgi:hypothetical protein